MDPFEFRPDLSGPYSFEFHGGPSDGLVIRTDALDPAERTHALGLLVRSRNGTIGNDLMGSASQTYRYRITSRREESGRVRVCLRYEIAGVLDRRGGRG